MGGPSTLVPHTSGSPGEWTSVDGFRGMWEGTEGSIHATNISDGSIYRISRKREIRMG